MVALTDAACGEAAADATASPREPEQGKPKHAWRGRRRRQRQSDDLKHKKAASSIARDIEERQAAEREFDEQTGERRLAAVASARAVLERGCASASGSHAATLQVGGPTLRPSARLANDNPMRSQFHRRPQHSPRTSPEPAVPTTLLLQPTCCRDRRARLQPLSPLLSTREPTPQTPACAGSRHATTWAWRFLRRHSLCLSASLSAAAAAPIAALAPRSVTRPARTLQLLRWSATTSPAAAYRTIDA